MQDPDRPRDPHASCGVDLEAGTVELHDEGHPDHDEVVVEQQTEPTIELQLRDVAGVALERPRVTIGRRRHVWHDVWHHVYASYVRPPSGLHDGWTGSHCGGVHARPPPTRYPRAVEPDDTDPRARAVHHRLLREAGPDRRGGLALRLSSTLIRGSRDAIRRQHPELDELGVKLLWVELHYGKELADRLRLHLAASR